MRTVVVASPPPPTIPPPLPPLALVLRGPSSHFLFISAIARVHWLERHGDSIASYRRGTCLRIGFIPEPAA